MFNSRLSRHEEQNLREFKQVRKGMKVLYEEIKDHRAETKKMREDANEQIEARHKENQADNQELKRTVEKMERLIWVATGVVAVVGFLLKEVAVPLLVGK